MNLPSRLTLTLAFTVIAGCTVPDSLGLPTSVPSTVTEEPGLGGQFSSVLLARPRIAEPDPSRPRYVREEWDGDGWADEDHDGCNTRAEVLMAESSVPTTRKANCTVLAGSWVDPWTGRTHTAATELQVDHLVALGDAAASGGWAWSTARKVAYTNDLSDPWHLNATAGAVNQSKADKGPDAWLPPLVSARCGYVAAYASIKQRWGLTVTPATWAAIERVWAGCGS